MSLSALKARVRGGRLLLDEPTVLPEGTELDLIVDPGEDELDDDDCRRLHEALREGWESVKAGDTVPAEDLLLELEALEPHG
jgi:hypothetical protein